VSTPATIRSSVALASLVLAERLLAPATAWAMFRRTATEKIVVAFVLGAVFTLRVFTQHVVRARSEASLIQRVISSLLHGDVLRANVLANEDARAELGQAVFHCAQMLAQELPLLAADLFASVVLAIVVVYAEPSRLALGAAVLMAFSGLALLWSKRRVQRAAARVWKTQQRVFEGFVDALEGRLEIVASGRRDDFLCESARETRAWAAASVHVGAATVLSGRIPLMAMGAAIAAVAVASVRSQGTLSVTLADIALFASVTPAFAGIAQGVHALERSGRWLRLVAETIGGARGVHRGSLHVPTSAAPIAFEGVSFRYDSQHDEADALREVSFQCGAGAVLALAGANGSGKSTCLRLLLALAHPTAGRVRVGGVDLRELDVDAWRSCVAFLPQRPYLPPRSSVRASIRFLAPNASDQHMRRALSRVGVLSALERTAPDPLDVLVDDLSVGQRQRVALARLLCRDARTFVLDEPDANLDRAGIALVAELIRELASRGSVVFAAHSAELLQAAEFVVTLDGGRVVENKPAALGC
jgi:ABC-type multidrug transport system fused ATPase/permease subunit